MTRNIQLLKVGRTSDDEEDEEEDQDDGDEPLDTFYSDEDWE